MASIRMYTTTWCGYCVRAKALLDSRGLEYEEIKLEDDAGFRARLHELTGGWTVPQILIDDRPIGGFTELSPLAPAGPLGATVSAQAPGLWPYPADHVARPPPPMLFL